ncbi:Uncharacterised protein [Mycobacteroides abscessus subsp. abscessus]|nr:Uncharacterised protein [Mycobacteroides abscessus subsp. abscessus]
MLTQSTDRCGRLRRVGELDGRDHTESGAHLRHRVEVGERGELVCQIALEPRRLGKESLPLDDVEVGHRGCRSSRVAAIGVTVTPPDTTGVEGFGDARRDEDRTHRDVPRRQALRCGHHVGLEIKARRSEPALASDTAEAGHHLVGDEQHIVVAADLSDLGQIALGRKVDAARADDRLAEERGNLVGTDAFDQSEQALGVVPLDGLGVGHQGAVAVVVTRDARE